MDRKYVVPGFQAWVRESSAPGDNLTLVDYADHLRKIGRNEEAVWVALDAAKEDPSHKAYYSLAQAYSAFHKDREAIEAIDVAMKIAPKKFSYWGFKCQLLASQGNLDGALFEYFTLMHVIACTGDEGWRRYVPQARRCIHEHGDSELLDYEIGVAERYMDLAKSGKPFTGYHWLRGEWRHGLMGGS